MDDLFVRVCVGTYPAAFAAPALAPAAALAPISHKESGH